MSCVHFFPSWLANIYGFSTQMVAIYIYIYISPLSVGYISDVPLFCGDGRIFSMQSFYLTG